jgi:hypothetical protein
MGWIEPASGLVIFAGQSHFEKASIGIWEKS